MKLTPAERDVLGLLTKRFMTPKKIAVRRKCSQQAVSKIISSLRKKGALKHGCDRVVESRPTPQPSQPSFPVESHLIRLHGMEFNVKILDSSVYYSKILKKCNKVVVDGCTVRLYKSSVEVYGTDKSFFGETPQMASSRAFAFWDRFFVRLENDLRVVLVKSRCQNIRLVSQHFSETANEFAVECERNKERIKVHTRDDGKLWFTIDNSFNLHEAETLHPKTSKRDMEDVVQPHFNDLRDNESFLPSQVTQVLHDISVQNKRALEMFEALARSQINASDQFAGLVKALKPRKPKGSRRSRSIPVYIG